MRRAIVKFLFRGLFLLPVLAAPTVPAAQVTLAWNPNSDTVAGYRLHCGTYSRVYTQTIEVGNATTTAVSNLVGGATYFFAVTAYNSTGMQSATSDEISYTVPDAPPTPTPTPAPTPAATATPTPAPTTTPTPAATPTPAPTPPPTPTPTATPTPSPVPGTQYYVSTSGNDSNRGTIDSPWRSISHGISLSQPGATLNVRAGSYYETIYANGLSNVTIKTYNAEQVTLIGPGLSSARIKFLNCHYVTFDGFEVTNYNQGIFVDASDHFTLRNCNVHDVGQQGITVHLGSSFVTVDGCTVHDTRKWQYNGEGIYVGTGSAGPLDNTNNVVVRNCLVYNTTDEGIELKPGTHHCLVENNTLERVNLGSDWSQNNLDARIGAIEVNQSVAGVQHWDTDPSHIIRNNTISDCTTAISLRTGGQVTGNLISAVATNGIYVGNPANDPYVRYIWGNSVSAPTAINPAGGTVRLASPTAAPTPAPTPYPTPTPTPAPSPTPAPAISPSPVPSPSATPAPSPSPSDLTISGITVSLSPSKRSAVIRWHTSIPSAGAVSYGKNAGMGVTQSAIDGTTCDHSVTLNNLSKRVQYYFCIKANSADGVAVTSAAKTFNTR